MRMYSRLDHIGTDLGCKLSLTLHGYFTIAWNQSREVTAEPLAILDVSFEMAFASTILSLFFHLL